MFFSISVEIRSKAQNVVYECFPKLPDLLEMAK